MLLVITRCLGIIVSKSPYNVVDLCRQKCTADLLLSTCMFHFYFYSYNYDKFLHFSNSNPSISFLFPFNIEATDEIMDPIGIKLRFCFFPPNCKIPFLILDFHPNCKIPYLVLCFLAFLFNFKCCFLIFFFIRYMFSFV